MGDQSNMCGSCLKMDINHGCAELGGATPGHGEKCKFRPSRWQSKHEGMGRKFGYPQEWQIIHEKPKEDKVSFTTKKGKAVTFTSTKGKAKSGKKSKSR